MLAVGLWAFVELADGVLEGDADATDRSVLLAFRTAGDSADPVGPQWMEEAARDLTALGSVLVLVLLSCVVAVYLTLRGQWRSSVFLSVSVALAAGGSFALKRLFSRPRPELVAHEVWTGTSSFPSSHSMMSAATFITIAVLVAESQRPWWLRLYCVLVGVGLALAVGVSRIYLGVHWPSDVLAGFVLGTAWALFSWSLFRALRRQGAVEERR